jgi:shikimate dehydrogenase
MKSKEKNHQPETQELQRPENLATELWFKGSDENALLNIKQHINNADFISTIRLGDRSEKTTNPKGGYKPGDFVTIKIQRADGSFEDQTVEAAIASTTIKKLSDLSEDEIQSAVLDAKSLEDLKKRLTVLYQREISDEEIITVVNFEFEKNLLSANGLLKLKTLKPAELPADNPKDLEFEAYTIPFIEHDYPAKTPVMWNAAYKKFGLKIANVMMVGNPKDSKQILGVMKRDEKYLGGGAGVGFKDEVVKSIDLDPLAEAVGSVNFIKKEPNNELRGYNTDGIGYVESLQEKFASRGEDLSGKKAVVLGAGGTGNSVAFALAEKGMKVVILNRTVKKAEELAKKINEYYGEERALFGGEDKIAEEIKNADAIINVSTKGASGDLEQYSALAPGKLPATPENIQSNLDDAEKMFDQIPKSAIVSDIVLTKKGTPLLNVAKAKGFETLDGVPMVINQGVEAFWILHQKKLEAKGVTKEELAKVMKEAAEKN